MRAQMAWLLVACATIGAASCGYDYDALKGQPGSGAAGTGTIVGRGGTGGRVETGAGGNGALGGAEGGHAGSGVGAAGGIRRHGRGQR